MMRMREKQIACDKERREADPNAPEPNLQLHSDAQCNDDDKRKTSKQMTVLGMNAT